MWLIGSSHLPRDFLGLFSDCSDTQAGLAPPACCMPHPWAFTWLFLLQGHSSLQGLIDTPIAGLGFSRKPVWACTSCWLSFWLPLSTLTLPQSSFPSWPTYLPDWSLESSLSLSKTGSSRWVGRNHLSQSRTNDNAIILSLPIHIKAWFWPFIKECLSTFSHHLSIQPFNIHLLVHHVLALNRHTYDKWMD